MLTIFTAAKPFRGRRAVIQRNALQSWALLHPEIQIMLFGDTEGSQEVAWELGLHFEPAELTKRGAVRMDYMFARAQQRARFNALCYVPCDTMLLPDFCEAFNRVEALYLQFAMVGRSSDLCLDEAVPFADARWHTRVRRAAELCEQRDSRERIGYVAFSKGLYLSEMPAWGIDDPCCANWLLWKALEERVATVDASDMVVAVRQDLDLILDLWDEDGADDSTGPLPQAASQQRVYGRRFGGPSSDAQSAREKRDRERQVCELTNAPYVLTPGDIVRNRWYRLRYWQGRMRRRGAVALKMWRELASHFGKTSEMQPGGPQLGVGEEKDKETLVR